MKYPERPFTTEEFVALNPRAAWLLPLAELYLSRRGWVQIDYRWVRKAAADWILFRKL